MKEKQNIGLVVAIELAAIFELYPNVKKLDGPAGFETYCVEKENYNLYIAKSGMGECAASAAVQYLVSRFNVTTIVNFGVVGGLTAEMKQMKVCLVERVVHYKYDCSEFMPLKVGQVDGYDSIYLKTDETLVVAALAQNPDLHLVTCCSGDKFVGSAEEKTYLAETFGGNICDMESAGIILTCDINRVPCIMFKAVSDGLADGADGFFKELERASKACLEIADKVIERII